MFATTQRIPADNKLTCQCFTDKSEHIKPSVLQAPISCIQGYTVELSSALWAGLLPIGNSSLRPTSVNCPVVPMSATPYVDSQTQLLMAQKKPNTDPIDVVSYENSIIPGGGAPVTCFQGYTVEDIINYKPGGPFAVEYCFSSYCRGNSQSNWYLASVDGPCVGNREGPLCGSCKPGYALTLYSTVSRLFWWVGMCTYKGTCTTFFYTAELQGLLQCTYLCTSPYHCHHWSCDCGTGCGLQSWPLTNI